MIISINSFEKLSDEKHYVYHLTIQYKDWSVTIPKRYSEFLELHQVMKVIKRNTGHTLPKFPKKMKIKYFLRLLSNQDIHTRRQALESYMNELKSGQLVTHSRYFIDFINLPIRFRKEWLESKLLESHNN